jgi:hypothetical protein
MVFNFDGSVKENRFITAYESGHRLPRRDANMRMAFTYGRKINLDELDQHYDYFKRTIKDDIK